MFQRLYPTTTLAEAAVIARANATLLSNLQPRNWGLPQPVGAMALINPPSGFAGTVNQSLRSTDSNPVLWRMLAGFLEASLAQPGSGAISAAALGAVTLSEAVENASYGRPWLGVASLFVATQGLATTIQACGIANDWTPMTAAIAEYGSFIDQAFSSTGVPPIVGANSSLLNTVSSIVWISYFGTQLQIFLNMLAIDPTQS